jgi:hypothetical protein
MLLSQLGTDLAHLLIKYSPHIGIQILNTVRRLMKVVHISRTSNRLGLNLFDCTSLTRLNQVLQVSNRSDCCFINAEVTKLLDVFRKNFVVGDSVRFGTLPAATAHITGFRL